MAESARRDWQQAIELLSPLNRVHAGPDMQDAYRQLMTLYRDNTELISYDSGSTCGSWRAPQGWVVHKARLTGPDGGKIVDWHDDHILCLFSYSPAFSGTVSRGELEQHLFSNPEKPDSYPFYFRNQYRPEAERRWGFCLPDKLRKSLPDGTYEVQIETEFTDHPTEMVLQTHKGELNDSLLLVGHFDHPAQCGDGLLGCIAGHEIISRLSGRKTKLTYRMLSTVEIVGSVFYCGDRARDDGIAEALFSALSGVDAPLQYAQSVHETAAVDRVMKHILRHAGEETSVIPFRTGIGNDETAFDVFGVNIPCGSLMRWPYAHYHTSDDGPDKVSADKFETFVSLVLGLIDVFEQNAVIAGLFEGLPYLSHPDIDLYLSPPLMSGMEEEPNRATRELLESLPGNAAREAAYAASGNFNLMMTLLPGMADGRHTVLDLAERSGVPFAVTHAYTQMWADKGLLEKTWVHPFQGTEKIT